MQTSHRPAITAPAGMSRPYWALLLVPLSLVSAASLAVDAWVREWIPEGRSFWIVQPVLYMAHGQNLDTPPAVSLPVGGAAIVFMVVLVRLIRIRNPSASPILELTAALVLGGAFADAVEVVANGSVTDFLGIRGSGGIYSASDVAFDLGVALFPLTTFKVAEPISRRRTALIAGAFAYLVVIAIALMNPRSIGVAFLATTIVVVSSTVLLIRSRSSEPAADPSTEK
jgi:signal peptidase (SPase) II